MNIIVALYDLICLLRIFQRAGGLDQAKRIFDGKTNYLISRIEDIEGAMFSAFIQNGKKRKREDAFSSCVTKGQELVQEARDLLGHGGVASPGKKTEVEEQSISFFQTCAALVNCHKLIKRLSAHEKEAGLLLKGILSDGRGPIRGNLIPVKELFGEGASVAMEQLQDYIQGNEVGRIAIHGIKGIGKTFLMKHLHDFVLNRGDRFDHVFWVTSPCQFSIKRVQDAVATALKCRLRSDDNEIRRAEVLSKYFSCLGRFVIFLDDVPEVHFSLAQIGIPFPAGGSENKLVLTSRSTLVSQMLGCSGTVYLDRLTDEEACQLFMNEAGISEGSAHLLKNIPSSIAKNCDGVPHKITDIATRMRGIDDPREWNNVLFEFRRSSIG